MMTRVIRLLEQWLPHLAYLSGFVVPVSQVDANTVPDLDQQLQEILDFVVLQEQMWRPERRIKGAFASESRKPPPT